MNEAAASARGLRRRVAIRVGALALVVSVIVQLLAARQAWRPARELMLSRGSGWVALAGLLLSLLITPGARIAARLRTRIAAAGVIRRALGMAAAWLALGHALVGLGGTLAWDWPALITWPHLTAGLTALALLLLLLATSYTSVVLHLRIAFFKELHRLAYAAAGLVLIHVMLAPFAPHALTLGLFLATFVIGLGRFL